MERRLKRPEFPLCHRDSLLAARRLEFESPTVGMKSNVLTITVGRPITWHVA